MQAAWQTHGTYRSPAGEDGAAGRRPLRAARSNRKVKVVGRRARRRDGAVANSRPRTADGSAAHATHGRSQRPLSTGRLGEMYPDPEAVVLLQGRAPRLSGGMAAAEQLERAKMRLRATVKAEAHAMSARTGTGAVRLDRAAIEKELRRMGIVGGITQASSKQRSQARRALVLQGPDTKPSSEREQVRTFLQNAGSAMERRVMRSQPMQEAFHCTLTRAQFGAAMRKHGKLRTKWQHDSA